MKNATTVTLRNKEVELGSEGTYNQEKNGYYVATLRAELISFNPATNKVKIKVSGPGTYSMRRTTLNVAVNKVNF